MTAFQQGLLVFACLLGGLGFRQVGVRSDCAQTEFFWYSVDVDLLL